MTDDLTTDLLHRNLEMLKATLSDFSDADMLVRPCPGANHAAWQLGHLIVSENRLINGVTPGAVPALPAGFAERFDKAATSKDDAAAFPKKAEMLVLYDSVRAASAKWAKGLSAADKARPAPEAMRAFVPTVGHLEAMLPNHVMMHVGQFQVIRRKLGKPILF